MARQGEGNDWRIDGRETGTSKVATLRSLMRFTLRLVSLRKFNRLNKYTRASKKAEWQSMV